MEKSGDLLKDLRFYGSEDWVNSFCPICGGADNRCSQTYDGAFGVCYKPDSSAINYKSGKIGDYGTYLLDPEALELKKQGFSSDQFTSTKRELKEISVQDELLLDSVHRRLISLWDLSDVHFRFLESRGLSESQIQKQLYRTSDNSAKTMSSLVKEFGPALLNIPGFSQVLGEYYFKSSNALLIPTINQYEHVINFRVRNIDAKAGDPFRYFYVSSFNAKDRNSTGKKAYVSPHVLIPNAICDDRIWVTEGEIKAHLASDKLSARFIAIPGVGTWHVSIPAIEHLKGRTIVLAFDKDMWRKKEVASALINFHRELKDRGHEVQIANW